MGDRLTITGKRQKQRVIAILPAVREAIATYLDACPYPVERDKALFRTVKGAALYPSAVQKAVADARGMPFLFLTHGYADPDYRPDPAMSYDCFGKLARATLVEDGRRIVITGAGGWIGLATLDLLAAALGDRFEKRVRAFGSSTRTMRLADGTQVLQRPLSDMAWLPGEPTIVLHTAFLTKDRAEVMDEAAYIAANRAISEAVLKALGPIGAEAIFVASSGAAAKVDDPKAGAAMRLYGALKREDEERFAAWADETGKRAVIARIYALTGPYINKPGAYAIASFLADAMAGRPVEVRAPKKGVRAYVPIRE
ncbi:hypothetical protein E4T56_gene1887, partial [Termitomyces sp. T112]